MRETYCSRKNRSVLVEEGPYLKLLWSIQKMRVSHIWDEMLQKYFPQNQAQIQSGGLVKWSEKDQKKDIARWKILQHYIKVKIRDQRLWPVTGPDHDWQWWKMQWTPFQFDHSL